MDKLHATGSTISEKSNVKFLRKRTPQEGSQSINGDLPISLESTNVADFAMIQKCEWVTCVKKKLPKLRRVTKSYTNLQLTWLTLTSIPLLQWQSQHCHWLLHQEPALAVRACGWAGIRSKLLGNLTKFEMGGSSKIHFFLFFGTSSKICRTSDNEVCSGPFWRSNSVLSFHMLRGQITIIAKVASRAFWEDIPLLSHHLGSPFELWYPRSKPIHHTTLDPRNQKSWCLSAVAHRAHLLRGYSSAPEIASFFSPKSPLWEVYSNSDKGSQIQTCSRKRSATIRCLFSGT